MPSVLVLLPDGFEELEAIAPIDLLRRAGAEVTVAALGDGIHVTGRSGITVHADTTLSSVDAGPRDCILLPGGPGVRLLRADPRVGALLKRQALSGGWIAAICAAPTVLLDAGLLAGRTYTAHHSVAAELPDRLDYEKVVIDGRILTSRGAGTALDFGLALVSVLISPQKALDIAASIAA